MTKKTPKRPQDLNQLVVDLATGEAEAREPTLEEQAKDPVTAEHGQLGGLKGGRARADTLPSARRQEIARNAAKARWDKD